MTVKLHLFSGFENKKLGITSDMELGHLYEDTNNSIILTRAAVRLGLCPDHIQNADGFIHFDIWGNPLRRAKQQFPIVDDIKLGEDMIMMKRGKKK